MYDFILTIRPIDVTLKYPNVHRYAKKLLCFAFSTQEKLMECQIQRLF